MKNMLEQIVTAKRAETDERKSLYPVKLLERSVYFPTSPVSLQKYILREDLSGVIAEFKRKSPSKGLLNAFADAEKITLAYMQAGASALSVLTDESFFGGKNKDLESARRVNYCPILRKDFILGEYQVIEAKAIGADAILLIAAILSKAEIKNLAALAVSLGMEVLLEVHDETELEKIPAEIKLLGINNRNLSTFEVNVDQSFRIGALVNRHLMLVSESGISDPGVVAQLRRAGFSGFLIGETFMKEANPGAACAKFIARVKQEILKPVNV